MKIVMYFNVLVLLIFGSCSQEKIKFELYSNNIFILEIKPEDIEFYDTTQIRNGIGVHEMRLKESFYKQDSFILRPPLELICSINGNLYFRSTLYHKSQSQPRLWVNFKFRNSCKNWWTFQEQDVDSLILRTNNECNSIEFFHKKEYMKEAIDRFYMKQEYFRNYIDTARLAHEILYDPYYLDALKESGVEIR